MKLNNVIAWFKFKQKEMLWINSGFLRLKVWNIFMKFDVIEQWKQWGVINFHVKWKLFLQNPVGILGMEKTMKLKVDNDANTACHFCYLRLDKTLDWPLLVTNIGKPTALCELTVFAAYIEFNTIPFWFPLPRRLSPPKGIACDKCVISILFTKEAWGQGNVDI